VDDLRARPSAARRLLLRPGRAGVRGGGPANFVLVRHDSAASLGSRGCLCLEAALRRTNGGRSLERAPGSGRRGLRGTHPPPRRLVARFPADLTDVGQCVSPSPCPPLVLSQAATKLVRHARPPSLPGEPTTTVIPCPRDEADHSAAGRGAHMWATRSCFRLRLSRKASAETTLRVRRNAWQSKRAPRPRDGLRARDGRDGRFRSPPLQRIQGARRGFVRQPCVTSAEGGVV
jgi:hypothetical protein